MNYSNLYKFYTPLFLLVALGISCNDASEISLREANLNTVSNAKPIYNYQSPEETIKSITVPEGYRLELVASEPMIDEPVAIVWDGNGRMYVAEMRTYMQDVNGTGTDEAISRISLLEDTDGDGKMDKSTVFIDSLLLPRMIMSLDDRLVVAETYSNSLWSYRDTDGDGIADEKLLIYDNPSQDNRNLEHQRSGLVWNLDNWIYIARAPVRFKFKENTMVVDTLYDAPFSQWGIGNDDHGRLFFSIAGGEVPANGFQINPKYGNLEMEGQLEKGFEATWPVITTPDVQGGLHRLREDGTLNHFTAPCGQTVFRGDRLPENIRGDLFICEPVGRLIRRAKITDQNGKMVIKNVYDQQEFMTSNDMNFRPVNTATGPDGNLYIVDMYRGIIQESNWTKEGSFLRPVILEHDLDKNTGRGRIYRLVHEDHLPGSLPNMLNETTDKLVDHLSHPNGWWRDQAQKMIVLRADTSVIPELTDIALGEESFLKTLFFWKKKPDALTRLHALWTMEGLGAINRSILMKAFLDQNAEVRKAAIQMSEVYLKEGDGELLVRLAEFMNDPSIEVRKQLVLSLQYTQVDGGDIIIDEIKEKEADNEMLAAITSRKLLQGDQWEHLRSKIASRRPAQRKLIMQGAEYYNQLCVMCHGKNGQGTDNGNGELLAPPLSGSKRVNGNQEHLVNILLHGLSGPIDGKSYPDVMPSMKAQSDDYIASVLSYIRVDMDNSSGVVSPQTVEEIRAGTTERKTYWTLEELESVD